MPRSSTYLPLVLAALAFGCSDPPAPPRGGSASAPAGSASAAPASEEALAGIDTSKLTAREKKELVGQLAEIASPCPDTPVPLGVCLSEKRACKLCKPGADYLARLVRAGAPKAERQRIFEARFDPKAVQTIELGEAPAKGPADAPVTIVEWADFECPHCAMMREAIELLMERFPGQVRVVYKFYALPSHTHAKDGALAAVAAQKQGKFWELHEALFVNQSKLERQDILRYAKSLELDMEKFKADFEAAETLARVESDMKQADGLGLEGTPLIYVNGRKVLLESLNPFFDEFEAWLKLEIELAGKTPAEPSEKFKEAMRKAEEAAKNQPSPEELERLVKQLEAQASASASASAAPPSTSASAGPAGSGKPAASARKP
jgi:protein-disulfide isomerase